MHTLYKSFALVALAAAAQVGFAEDPYLASDGTQAINTGYFINAKTKIVVDFQLTAVEAQARLFGQDGGANHAVLYLSGGSDLGFGYGETWNATFFGKGDLNRHTAVYDAPHAKGYLYDNGVKVGEVDLSASSVTKTSEYPMAIFARNYADAKGMLGMGYNAKMRLYSFKIYEDDDLVHDYVPAVDGGYAGLYDRIEGTFFTDYRTDGSSPKLFSIGGDDYLVDPAPYVESDGTAGMNARIHANADMTAEIDFAMTDPVAQARLFGSDPGNSVGLNACLYLAGDLVPTFAWGKNRDSYRTRYTEAKTLTVIYADTARHTAILDFYRGRLAYCTGKTLVCDYDLSWDADNLQATSTYPLTLFSSSSGVTGTSFGQCAKMRIYGARFFQAGKLVHDYRPCVKGGVVGFKDAVDGEFITGEKPAAFSAGGAIERIADDACLVTDLDNKVSFDTKYVCGPNTRVDIDFAMVDTGTAQQRLWGASDGGSGYLAAYCYLNGGCSYAWAYQDESGNNTAMMSANTCRRTIVVDGYRSVAALVTSGYSNYVYTTATSTAFPGHAYSAAKTLKLLSNPSQGGNFASVRLYGAKIYESGELVHDYEPYLDRSRRAVLRDRKDGTLLYGGQAQIDGNYASAADAAEAYVASDGTQAMVSDYYINGKTKIEIDFQMKSVTQQQRVFGQDGNGCGNHAVIYISGGNDIAIGYGSTWKVAALCKVDAQRHTVVYDAANAVGYIVTDGVKGADQSLSDVDCDANYPMAIFGMTMNSDGTSVSNMGAAKIFSVRIYEEGELVRHYLPYCDGTKRGMKDVLTGAVLADMKGSSSALEIGGVGYEGADNAFYTQPQDVTVSVDGTKTLSVYAPGAVGYQWYKNGEAVDGATGMTLEVPWEKLKSPRTVVYTAKATFDCYGVEIERESEPATVTMGPLGCVIILR